MHICICHAGPPIHCAIASRKPDLDILKDPERTTDERNSLQRPHHCPNWSIVCRCRKRQRRMLAHLIRAITSLLMLWSTTRRGTPLLRGLHHTQQQITEISHTVPHHLHLQAPPHQQTVDHKPCLVSKLLRLRIMIYSSSQCRVSHMLCCF